MKILRVTLRFLTIILNLSTGIGEKNKLLVVEYSFSNVQNQSNPITQTLMIKTKRIHIFFFFAKQSD